ncbi:HET-domain-containing protein [Lophiostoma macrostomum CBS 122681]|uniref:HET-domain-containing protein n=1 Tax=Lophiostoma macrostomum CBS 122681 TaxID=1314788 RepID=A0A6A6TS60_9PLEO|nr:HET-domain-containing protein [Lophiostoma macrostomum CBS 122681]
MPRLLRANYDQYKKRIETSSLPSVFQDAITMTRRLEIGYLWVDCLCIIQDDELDWDTESSRMGQVYSGAFCNFGACAAADSVLASFGDKTHVIGDVGLFVERDSQALYLPAVPVVRKDHRKLYYAYTNLMHPKLALSSLMKRGWILQERLMSTRSIYFANQLGWECGELVTCETFPNGMPAVPVTAPWGNVTTPFKINNLLERSALHSSQSSNADERTEMEKKWLCVAERFQSCRLTFENDRLPALSGLAQCFHRVLHDEYLAGIWKNDLYRSLLWYRSDPQVNLHIPSDLYPVPTWSWASAQGSIRFPLAHQHCLKFDEEQQAFTLLETTLSGLTRDPFGRVKKGAIRIAGHMRKGSERRTDTRTEASEKRKYNDWYDGASSNGDTFHLLLGYSRCIVESSRGPLRVLRGLIVSPAKSPSQAYRRVGMFMHPWPPGESDMDIFHEFVDFNLADPQVTITLV